MNASDDVSTVVTPLGEVPRTVAIHRPEVLPESYLHHSVRLQLAEIRRLLSDPLSPEALADRDLGPQSLLVKVGWRIWTGSLPDSEQIEELLRVSGASCAPSLIAE